MRSALLEGLTDDEQRLVLAKSRVRMLVAKETLASESEPVEFAALIQLGHLKLSRSAPDGTDVIVRYMGPGEPFAAIAVLAGSRFPVTATAVTAVRVLTWTATDMRALSDQIPRLKTNLMSAMSGHMTGALTRMQELTSDRVPQRVARALVRLARDSGERTPQGWRILHPITRQELAELTGTTLFTVSRLVSAWESEGLLRTSRGAMTVVDPDALEDTADSTE